MKLTGFQVKACCVALEEFGKKKNGDLEHFSVYIYENADGYEIVFVPNQPNDEPSVRGGRTKFGREVHYHISKDKFEIIKTSFGR